MASPPFEMLAQYRLQQQVGAGAMGVVHRAFDVDLERPVAIKLLHPDDAGDAELVQRFLREARSAAQVLHPNVALVYQAGQHDGRIYIVMEWLGGGDLAQALKQQGPLPWRDAAAAARDAAAGLAAAHAAGLVHRDIKPSNLMRNDAGKVKLVDFGLARLHESPSELTQTGMMLGTPAYMSPEQCRGEPATPLSDVYALGCTLFCLLAGKSPHADANAAAMLIGHLQRPLPDLRARVPGIPEALCRIVERAAAKEPLARYRDAAALLADLQALLDGRPLAATAADATLALTELDLPVARDASAAIDVPLALDAPAAPVAPPGNLPLETGALIGREGPLAQLDDLLRQSRLVTLTGPGGSGKTRLALHQARRQAARHADGAWVVELAALPAQADVALAVAAALGVAESTGEAVESALARHLAARDGLLVLDNCEHLVAAAAALTARLLAACPRLQVLATSRQALGCPGEYTLGVPPLAAPESLRLFAERARAVRPGFEIDAATAPVVAQICARLDGIPLAIELAAARVRSLAPAQIAARLDDAFKLLTSGHRTLLPRQQTLRALIDWSWDLLDAGERLALARCSVFAGEFTLEAAEAVLADDGAAAPAGLDPLDAVAALVDKSLLVATERAGAVRYAMLQTIRQYAAEKLGADDAFGTRRRHAAYYTGFVVAARGRFDSPDHAQVMAAIALEHEQARAALDAATAERWFDIALPLGVALANYWNLRGILADGVERVARLVAAVPPDGAETAALLRHGADLATRCGRNEQARAWLEQALPMARVAGETRIVGQLLNGLGSLAYAEGRYKRAERHFAEYLAAASAAGDRDGQIRAVNNLAIVLRRLGRPDEARRHFHGALASVHEMPNPRLVAYLKVNIGDLEEEDGRPAVARPYYEACLEVLAPLGETWGIALARAGLGKCALALGESAQARAQLEAALDLLQQLGERSTIAEAQDQLARIARIEGQADEAGMRALAALRLRIEAANLPDLAASFDTWALLTGAAQPAAAARLLGCAAAVRLAQRAPLEAAKARQDRALRDDLRRRLGEAAFEAAIAEGAANDPTALARALAGD
ncbi:MAG: protein kinase [Burkholderiales bacterium]|nr:protein kinase [Burkholderiales bacterium]